MKRESAGPNLIGFRLRKFLGGPFYCLRCLAGISCERGWAGKTDWSRKPAIPIIRSANGELVRHVEISGSATKPDGSISDPVVVAGTEAWARIHEQRIGLGLRLSSSGSWVVHPRIRCKGCGRGLYEIGPEEIKND